MSSHGQGLDAHSAEALGKTTGAFSRLMHAAYNVYIWVTLGSLLLTWYAKDKQEYASSIASILSALVGASVIVLIIFLAYFAVSYSKKARYAEISKSLHDIHHSIRDVLSAVKEWRAKDRAQAHSGTALTGAQMAELKEGRRVQFESSMTAILTQVVSVFTIATGTSCRSSIKILSKIKDDGPESHDNLGVLTLVRDAASAQECHEKDSEDRKNKAHHLVSKNTDFSHILGKKGRIFISGNICKYSDYANSSEDYWRRNRPIQAWANIRAGFLGAFSTHATSVFPYNSVMVLPIRGKTVGHSAVGSSAVLGFLTIDSIARNCFDDRYDAPVAASIADSLFHLLEEYGLLSLSQQTHAQG